MTLRREVKFSPAFDKRHSDLKKNYGIHGVEMTFLVIGPEGAVQFVVYTNWQLPHVQAELDAKEPSRFPHWHPIPADLGYHSPKPHYEGQTSMGPCSALGRECFYDGSTLNAEPIFDLLLREGGDSVWHALEVYYASTFKPKEPT